MNEKPMYKVLYNFKADGESELSVKKGEVLRLLKDDGEWYMVAKVDNEEEKGYVPALYIAPMDSTASIPQKEKKKKKPIIKKELKEIESQSVSTISASPIKPVPVDNNLTSDNLSSNNIIPTSNNNIPAATTTVNQQTKEFQTNTNNVPSVESRSRGTSNASSGILSKTSTIGRLSSKSTSSNATSSLASYSTKLKTTDIEESLSFLHTYENYEKVFKQTLQQRSEAFKKLGEKLERASLEIDQFREKNEELIDKIKRLDSRIETDRINLINNFSSDNSNNDRKRPTSSAPKQPQMYTTTIVKQ
ncbi:hypothetical protein ABK040_008619 [Willaertia magna]